MPHFLSELGNDKNSCHPSVSSDSDFSARDCLKHKAWCLQMLEVSFPVRKTFSAGQLQSMQKKTLAEVISVEPFLPHRIFFSRKISGFADAKKNIEFNKIKTKASY